MQNQTDRVTSIIESQRFSNIIQYQHKIPFWNKAAGYAYHFCSFVLIAAKVRHIGSSSQKTQGHVMFKMQLSIFSCIE